MKKKEIYVVLNNIRSRENVGSIFRTADGFKVSKIVGKFVGEGAQMFARTNDGFILKIGKEKVNVEDSVKISIPDMKISEVYHKIGRAHL